jgi:hypothetical protein
VSLFKRFEKFIKIKNLFGMSLQVTAFTKVLDNFYSSNETEIEKMT